MLTFKLMVTLLVALMLVKNDTDSIKKLLLFSLLLVLYTATFQLIPSMEYWYLYFFSNLIMILMFITLWDYKSGIWERYYSYTIVVFLLFDSILTSWYFNTLTDVWIYYVSHLKGDVFLLWIITVVAGQEGEEKKHMDKVVILVTVWVLSQGFFEANLK